MADVTNALLVSWDVNRCRPLANQMTQMLAALQAWQADYAAYGIVAAITAAGSTNNIGDGYEVNGWAPITGTQIENLQAGITQLVTAWNTTLVSGVGATVQSIQQSIQNAGSPI